MDKLKSLLVIILVTTCSTVTAFAAGENEKNNDKSIDQKLSSLKLEKMQVESMIATLVKRGHMNHEDATRIKREVASVKEQDLEVIKAEAIDKLESKNSFATK